MRPASERFQQTLRGAHQMAARARIVPPGLTGTNPWLDSNGNPKNEIPILGGDVKLDSTADIRGSLDMDTAYDWPADASALLTPYGNEIFVERGIDYGDGDVEYVSQGYYRIYSVDQDDAPDGPIKIAAKDRMSGIVDDKPLAPKSFAAGTSVSAIFSTVVGDVYPTAVIQFDFDAASMTFPTSHVMEDDRYTFLKDIVDSLGKIMFWDYQGRLQVMTAPDPAVAVFQVNHGAKGVLVSMSRSLDREGVYNAVVATGEAPGENPPVRAVAYDYNTASPTYWNGSFGKVPTFYTSSFITTVDQAKAAAEAKLARVIGLPYNVNFNMVPNPALEPLDPIRVSYSDRKVPETHVIETLTIPLTSTEVMAGTTRQQIQAGIQ